MPENYREFKASFWPAITAVILVFNRPDDLERLLTSFRILEYPGKINIIVVDDASTVDYSPVFEKFKALCPDIPLNVIGMSENMGPAHCRNAALEKISGGYVWFLDSDSEIFQPAMLIKAHEWYLN